MIDEWRISEMKIYKKSLLILLVCAICLSFASCFRSSDDWRNSGIVVDSGYITHSNFSTPVLVTVTSESAAFYRNLSEQVLFDSVLFPVAVPDAEEAFDGISFDDISNDGESDVVVHFSHEDGSITEMVWIWDPAERYVYREDLSTVALENSEIMDFIGIWEYTDGNLWLLVHDDGTWEYVNSSEETLDSGTVTADGNFLELHFADSSDVVTLERSEDGTELLSRSGSYKMVEEIPGSENNNTIRENDTKPEPEPDMVEENGDVSEYVGLWQYINDDLWLRIYDDYTWEYLNSGADVLYNGSLWVDEEGVTLHFEDSGDVLQLIRTVSGDLIDSVNEGTLVPVEAIEAVKAPEVTEVTEEEIPYFTEQGLSINALPNEGIYQLDNGVCSYSGSGVGYNTDLCYWEVVKNSDFTHDGLREIQFDAICYIPDSSIPIFYADYLTITSSELYDFYTGTWLTASSSFGNSSRGDNYYLHSINWNGRDYSIEYAYSTDWQEGVDGWAQVFTKSYVVYVTDGYDGLVFAAETQPGNYKDCSTKAELDIISPEAAIMDISLADPYNSLFFDICY